MENLVRSKFKIFQDVQDVEWGRLNKACKRKDIDEAHEALLEIIECQAKIVVLEQILMLK